MPSFSEYLGRRESARELTMASPPKPSDASQPQDHNRTLSRKLSEESLRTELCEGPIPGSPKPQTPEDAAIHVCSDRAELIERLKRGESPTWIPNRNFDSLWNQQPKSPTRSPKLSTKSPSLFPPPRASPEPRQDDVDDEKRLQEGLSIERPRSALHSGDFTQDESPRRDGRFDEKDQHRNRIQAKSGSHQWLATSPPRDFTPFHFERRPSVMDIPGGPRLGISSLSSSLSSSFHYQAPTSPLVQSQSNEDIDLTSPMHDIEISSSVPRDSRRHSYMNPFPSYFESSSPNQMTRRGPTLRQERTYPYQAHQPRRSLASTPIFSTTASSPATPLLRSRRPSYNSEASPMQHASMVGSYEESILRGRMSTTPSKPLEFVAQIGVLGLGKCKSSLRCPPHVSLPFPAVFYSYASSLQGRNKVDDGPSPYVGQIDLENGLSSPEEEARSKRKKQNRALERRMMDSQVDTDEQSGEKADTDSRKPQRQKRRSASPRAPPGGSYRIPEKGQIQIIIKNPNKTAVKLFLVPYDLSGMEPGTKTFIRQRSYSFGPIIEDVPGLKNTDTEANRPILRYLVHLHICCPSRARYYLYKSIRVVFANRVPDGKEKLRNEITLPEPRFSSYKPLRAMHPPTATTAGPGANLAAEKAFRRRSSGFYAGTSSQAFDATDRVISEPAFLRTRYSASFSGNHESPEPIPFELSNTQGQRSMFHDHAHPPAVSTSSRQPTQEINDVSSPADANENVGRYEKLSKGDLGYGGNAFSSIINGNPGAAEGLLSQRLRSLGVQAQSRQPDSDARED